MISRFVLDSSVAISWLLEDEKTEPTEEILSSLGAGACANAPRLLRYEVANGLLLACRRGRLSEKQLSDTLYFWDRLPIILDDDSERFTASTTCQLALQYQLTIYDASYIELAMRLVVPLATLDKRLQEVGQRLGISLVLLSTTSKVEPCPGSLSTLTSPS